MHLSGSISDPDLGSGVPGSGLQPDTFTVALVTMEGTTAGEKTRPNIDGDAWTVDYALTGPSPTGPYTLRAEAADRRAL